MALLLYWRRVARLTGALALLAGLLAAQPAHRPPTALAANDMVMRYFRDSGLSLGAQTSQSAALGDLDGDGDLDAFVVNGAGLVDDQADEVWLNDGTGTLSLTQQLSDTTSFAVALGDMDGDRDLDALVGTSGYDEEGALVWLNDGQGRFRDSGQRLGKQQASAVVLGDLDGDSDLDALIADLWEQGNRIWLNDGTGMLSDSGQRLGKNTSWDAALGDLDGDGDLDAFIANDDGQQSIGRNQVWFNDGKGHMQQSSQVFERASSTSVELGDLDGDGDLDAFVAHSDYAVKTPSQVLLNDGKGRFSDSGQQLGLGFNSGTALADFERDGDLDMIVARNPGTASAPSRVWVNDGRGHFQPGQTFSAGYNRDVVAGDLNGDGLPDFLLANSSFCDAICTGFPNEVWLNQVSQTYLPGVTR
ncbi:MAG: hypothetical protein OHK0022_26900 [Roseiflexaceae bacterium]